MPFTNEVIGTNGVLIRNWLQSQNYVTGVSGWQITKAGNAEFNNGTFRGSISVGPSPGPRFIVNNVATGDVIDVYGSAGQLLMNLIGTGPSAGLLSSYDPTNVNANVSLYSSEVLFATPDGSTGAVAQRGAPSGATQPQLFIQLVPGRGINQTLTLYGGSADGTQTSDLQSTTRNILGSQIQNDSAGINNLVHMQTYSGTVSGGDGHWIFPHNCSFTPKGAILTPYAAGGGDGPGYVRLWTNFADATNCYTIWTNDGGARTADGSTVGVCGLFFG